MNSSIVRNYASVPLGSIADFRNGINFTKANFGEGIKVIGVKDFKDYLFPKTDEIEEINPEGVVRDDALLRNEDILFVRSNGNRELIGRSLFIQDVDAPLTHSAFTIRVRFNDPNALPRFYAYVFRSSFIRQSLTAYGSGTNISNLNQTILEELQVPYPPIDIQTRIVSVLSAYDDLIENNTRRIGILEEMTRMIYREWFVNFRFPRHEQVEIMDSQMGKIPHGWHPRSFGEVLDCHIGGGWGEEEQSVTYHVKAFVIRGTDIPNVRHVEMKSVPLRYHKQSNFDSRRVQEGDIIFEVSGGGKEAPVGRALLISQQMLDAFDADVICASFCKLLRVNQSIISPEHAYLHLLDFYNSRRVVKFQVQSTGIKNLKFAHFLEDEWIIVPDNETTIRFREFVSPLFDQMLMLGRKNANLRRTRDLLLPKLVSGEIDVSRIQVESQ